MRTPLRGDTRESRQHSRHLQSSRHFVIRPTVQHTACLLLSDPTPLFEEKWHTTAPALVQHRLSPLSAHGAGTGARFAAHDNPVDALQWERVQWSDERLTRKEPYSSPDFKQILDAPEHARILYADPHPDVFRPDQMSRIFLQPFASLREHLEYVLRTFSHR